MRKNHGNSDLYHGESWELMERRWNKLEKDFLSKAGVFDISKVPDIYDCIKYDLQHNSDFTKCEAAEKLYIYAKNMADVVRFFFILVKSISIRIFFKDNFIVKLFF